MNEIGSALRSARESRRTTFVEAEQETKIRSKYLQALEEEQFQVLPGDVFAKGFLRTYADYLGLDGQRMIDAYNVRYVRPEEDDRQPLPVGRADSPRRFRLRRLVIGLFLVAIIALLALSARAGSSDPATPSGSPAEQGPSAASADRQVPREAQPRAAAKPADERRRADKPAGPTPLVIEVQGESWLEVKAKDESLFSGLATDGWTRRFAQDQLVVVVGNPAAVRLRRGDSRAHVNETGPVTFHVKPGSIKRV